MNVTMKVTPMYSEASLMDAVVVVDGKPGRCTAIDSRKGEITVSIPDDSHPWYEVTLGEGVRELSERRTSDQPAPEPVTEPEAAPVRRSHHK